MDGLLLIDKPSGWTSFDVVAKVRGIVKASGMVKPPAKPKVGHTGTLDPLATGLLVLTLGTYCKRAGEFSKLQKEYDVEVTLGQTSSTDDEEGQKTSVSNVQPSEEQVLQAVKSFTGEQQQTPPAFSAIKINGQRAYKLARQGEAPKMEPRNIIIYDIKNIIFSYPKCTFTAKVSSGTYIRSLARDIGEQLHTGAYMSALRRTSIGEFQLHNALPIADLSPEAIYQHLVIMGVPGVQKM